jgi:hypothetical protein
MEHFSEFMIRRTPARLVWLYRPVFLMVTLVSFASAQDAASPLPSTDVVPPPSAPAASAPAASAPAASAATAPVESAPVASAEGTASTEENDSAVTNAVEEQPWEYLPYRVQVWIASSDERASAEQLSIPLQQFLDRSFAAVWKTNIVQAPGPIQAAAIRDFESISYESITSVDPVLAIKRDHPEAPRLRFASDISKYIKKCFTTADRLAEVKRRGAAIGNETLDGALSIVTAVDGDAIAVSNLWKDQATEALILSRGMAADLSKPEAKIIRLPLENLVAEEIQNNDKVFIVRIDSLTQPIQVEVVELDCLMRQFSPIIKTQSLGFSSLPAVVGESIVKAFAPVVRIEDAGQKTAVGITRASGLVVPEDHREKHPALISEGEFLQPMVRKDDRNGNPIAIGPIPWAFLHVKKIENSRLNMDLYSGRSGGLQGRKNARTFRMALRTRPVGASSTIRLHAAGSPTDALAGYEVYEKKLDAIDMKLVGRTDWDGRIVVNKADAPMRLLYVKNGGAVLARLPIVPGLTKIEVADLMGDDQRLRAEAYIRGTQNAIVDLIAIRTLLAARIRLRLEKGQMAEAKELLEALKKEPTYDTIANEMGKKVVQIKGRTSVEQRKIDELFASTREMLVKNINSVLIRDLEADVVAAEANGGKLKKPAAAPESSASEAPASEPAASSPAPAATPPAEASAPVAAATPPATENQAPAPEVVPAPETQPAP